MIYGRPHYLPTTTLKQDPGQSTVSKGSSIVRNDCSKQLSVLPVKIDNVYYFSYSLTQTLLATIMNSLILEYVLLPLLG